MLNVYPVRLIVSHKEGDATAFRVDTEEQLENFLRNIVMGLYNRDMDGETIWKIVWAYDKNMNKAKFNFNG